MKDDADTRPVLAARLQALAGTDRLKLALKLVEDLGSRLDVGVTALLADELADSDKEELEAWLQDLPDTATAAWLRTRLLGDGPALLKAWDRLFSFQGRLEPQDLLMWARALNLAGEYDEATKRLRFALAQDPPYSFFARAEKLVYQLAARGRSEARQCRIAVLGSSTMTLLLQVLRTLCLRDQIAVEIYEGPFGAIETEILDPASGLARFRPGIVFLFQNWRDLGLDAVVADEERWIERFIDTRKALWSRLKEQFQCHVIQAAFDFPAEEPYGYLAQALRGGRARVLERLNLRMGEESGDNVSILDTAAVQREVGTKRWEDENAWTRYRQHPSTDALPALAEDMLSHIRAVLGLTKKVLVTDLDDTLWGGVIGEDGVEGIAVGPGTPEGEAHLRLQRYLLDLKRRGILLAVCSKNNPEDARLPFLQHAQMALRLEDFAAFQANWEDKATNLRTIARDLSLGLDSFVFLDDSPMEREWVRWQLPEVTVVEVGNSPFHFVRELDRGRYFQMLTLSAEDVARADQYRLKTQRESLCAAAASLDEFLANLQLKASVEPVTPANLMRITQLVNKTNQFNLTTRRYNEAEVAAIAKDPRGWAGAFQLSDRMGNYGLIGVILCRPLADARTWEVDTWLMSCRALGRQMEKFMFDRLVEGALQRGIVRIEGVYRATAKNGIVSDLYEKLGFRRVAGTGNEMRYELELGHAARITANNIANLAVSANAVAK
jgi:FkbH-like protein